jgi:hypothetical protein
MQIRAASLSALIQGQTRAFAESHVVLEMKYKIVVMVRPHVRQCV